MKEQEANQIQNHVPFEYDNKEKHQSYSEELNKFIDQFSNRQLSDIDLNIISELTDEPSQSMQEVTVPNNSVIGSIVSNVRDHKWD